MVLKGFELSDNDELLDEQDGCVPVHLHTGIMHKYSKICKICKICIKYADKYAIKYVEYANTFTDMQNMWMKKYAKYVAYAKYVN